MTASPSRSLILTADEVRDALAGKLVEIVRRKALGASIGDILYVREALSLRYGNVWCYDADNREVNRWNDDEWMKVFEDWCAERIDDETPVELDSVSSRSMPLWASRLTLRVTSVRVEQREGKWFWIVGVVKAA